MLVFLQINTFHRQFHIDLLDIRLVERHYQYFRFLRVYIMTCAFTGLSPAKTVRNQNLVQFFKSNRFGIIHDPLQQLFQL